MARRRYGQTFCSPASGFVANPSAVSRKERRVIPSEVCGTQWRASVAVKLLRESSTWGSIFGDYRDKVIGIVLDGCDNRGELRGARRICSCGNSRNEVGEESERGGGDGNGSLLFPHDEGIV